MTISVNPLTGLTLKDLWLELERAETDRWEGLRPTADPRPIVSYPAGTGYTQPWWDDHGRYTLVAGPRALPDGRPGSRLEWTNVLNALWRAYSPLQGVQVEDLLQPGPAQVLECCTRRPYHCGEGPFPITKYLLAMRWVAKGAGSGELFGLPTVRRYLGALVTRTDDRGLVAVEDFPSIDELRIVQLRSGFTVIHRQGVLIFDEGYTEPLGHGDLVEEFEGAFQILRITQRVASELDAIFQEPLAVKQRRTIAVLADLSTLRGWLIKAGHQYQRPTDRAAVREFRESLETVWNTRDAVKDLHTRVSQLEDAIRTKSALTTQRLAYLLSTLGLPLSISGALTGLIKPWLSPRFPGLGEAWAGILLYLVLSLSLGVLITIALRRWLRWEQENRRRVGTEGP